MLAISYITAHFLFASAKYLFTQNCKAPSGVEIFDGFSQSELKQDADLARRDLAKDAKIARRRAYAFDSLRLWRRQFKKTLDKYAFFIYNKTTKATTGRSSGAFLSFQRRGGRCEPLPDGREAVREPRREIQSKFRRVRPLKRDEFRELTERVCP